MKMRHRFDLAPAAPAAAPVTHAIATESLFDEANREWNARYGAGMVAVKRWRLAAQVSLALTMLLSVFAIRAAADVKFVPYVVKVEAAGKTVAVTRADAPAAPDAAVVRAQIASWIGDARSISADPFVERATLARVYASIGVSAKPYLDAWYSAHSPFPTATTSSVTVRIDAVVPLGADTYQVGWTEEQRDHNGSLMDSTQWEAQITAGVVPPSDRATILRNPLGIYVTQLSWTQRV
jgi:type IV secretion system protein VirB5